MRAIVTCGPSYEPIDEVRRITNFSTGELGVMLSDHLTEIGFDVICLRGTAATYPLDPREAAVMTFATNDDLEALLEELSREGDIRAVFHTAALCDYRVSRISGNAGVVEERGKIPSRHGELSLTLAPATKVISRMRSWFPGAVIAGWKYEVEGTIDDALAKAWMQIAENRSDACIVNGKAFGPDFGFFLPGRPTRHLANKKALCRFLAGWLLEEVIERGWERNPESMAAGL